MKVTLSDKMMKELLAKFKTRVKFNSGPEITTPAISLCRVAQQIIYLTLARLGSLSAFLATLRIISHDTLHPGSV